MKILLFFILLLIEPDSTKVNNIKTDTLKVEITQADTLRQQTINKLDKILQLLENKRPGVVVPKEEK